jgi:hypothetical protein
MSSSPSLISQSHVDVFFRAQGVSLAFEFQLRASNGSSVMLIQEISASRARKSRAGGAIEDPLNLSILLLKYLVSANNGCSGVRVSTRHPQHSTAARERNGTIDLTEQIPSIPQRRRAGCSTCTISIPQCRLQLSDVFSEVQLGLGRQVESNGIG